MNNSKMLTYKKLFSEISKLSPIKLNQLSSISHGYCKSEAKDILASEEAQLFMQKVCEPTFKPKKKLRFTFIDLFAGIGGFRMAMQNLGEMCIHIRMGSKSSRTYFHNYGEFPFGDIMKSTKDAIPTNFDVLCAGFPCQAFFLSRQTRGF